MYPAVETLLSEPGAELRETHCSWIVLSADRALKFKKPVRFPFLDYGTQEARRHACNEEVRLNRLLAPEIYLGVRSFDGEPAVEMRRYDEHATLAGLARSGRLRAVHIDAVAARIADFHRHAHRSPSSTEPGRWQLRAATDLTELEAAGGPPAEQRSRFLATAVARHGAVLEGRRRRGLVRDGHGDLRAEHVLDTSPITIVDRVEFDWALRCTDVADDLSFLAMDLEALGARWAADLLIEAYAAAGGDPAPPPLAALFAWRRAIVRAKVALLAERPLDAARLLDLADRLAWRARGPLTIAVIGPPASGKSTLAQALSRRLELPVVSSDVVRKQLHGLAPADRGPEEIYTERATAETYRAVIAHARAREAPDAGVIVDATFSMPHHRAELASALRGPIHWIACEAPEVVLAARAARRSEGGFSTSDAGPAVAVEMAHGFAPVDALEGVLELDTMPPLDVQVAAVAAWLDAP